MSLLAVEQIHKRFGGVHALRGVSLSLAPGEVHCLAGENGSGKSTLIKIIAGIHPPDAGRLVVDGVPTPALTPIAAIRHGIQVIYQDLALFPNLGVAENLALNTQLEQRRRWVNRRFVRETARRALAALELALDLDQPVGDLPVAQKQLVAIARALLHDARLIIMDEPTAALTQVEANALFHVIRRLRADGLAVLFISHHLREMLRIGDRFTVLRNGEVVAQGPASDFDEARLARLMTGRPPAPPAPRPRAAPTSAPPLLEVRGLAGRTLRDVSFDLAAGEVLGVAGLLGAGQTELALILFGLTPRRAGTIRFAGEERNFRSAAEAIAAGVAYLPEDRLTEGLFLPQSIALNLVAAGLRRLRNRAGLLAPARLRAHVTHWLRELRIQASGPDAPVQTLSGGNQQRVVLARWLAREPRLLIVNGPTVGVDVGSKEDLHAKLGALAAQGMGLLVISDDLPELVGLCDRVLVLHRGRVTREFRRPELTEPALAECLAALT